ncbi:MAG: DUF3488 and transglutaminase-like domain-containing protein [Planctomycetaceae bacterium]
MAQLSAVFQISVYALCCLASLMLAVADETPLPHLITLPLAVVALILTERQQAFRLPTFATNLLGTMALGYTLVRMSPLFLRLLRGGGIPEQGVLAEVVFASHFLVFLSWIVFFMHKRPREYWAMCTLSVLQVAIGALLTSSGTYGVLLACYLLLGIWTLSIFSIEQARMQLAESEPIAGPHASRAEGSGTPYVIVAVTHPKTSSLDAYWQRPSRPRNTIHLDPNERWISARFVTGILATALVSILISACFVVLTPRVWAGRMATLGTFEEDQPIVETGFTETVELGGESRISESNDLALEVRVFNNDTGEEMDVAEYALKLGQEEPLFRGAVLETYENRKWSTQFVMADLARSFPGPGTRSVRQEIRIQPMQSGVLFAMFPVRQCFLHERSFVAWQNSADVLMRYRQSDIDLLRNRFGAGNQGSGIPFNKPIEMTVHAPAESSRGLRVPRTARTESFDEAYLQMPEQGLTRLQELARQIAQRARNEGRSTEKEIALQLEAYLKDTPDFIYTLDIEQDDEDLDPLEDFLFNTKAAHCEYYASALALMLRAVGIRSRLVSGFKGGSPNQFSGEFEVQQRHAHAWVEALVGERWITLDPTPARERSEVVRRAAPRMLTWHDLKSFVESLWSNYVANADIGRQQARIYQPLVQMVREWWTAIKERKIGWTQVAAFFRATLKSPDKWFSWQGALLTLVLITVGIPAFFLAKRAAKGLRRLWRYLFGRSRASRDVIAFYERFRKICRARGLVRDRTQTQREFVAGVDRSLNSLLASAGLAAFPRQLVDRFYEVRFGGVPLDPEIAIELDQNLTRLEQSLKAPEHR